MALITLNNNSLSSITSLPAGIGGKILQVVSTSTNAMTSHSRADEMNNFLTTITPASTSSKILVNFQFNFLQNDPQYTSQFYIYRGGSSIYQKSDYHSSDTSQQRRIMNLMYLDSPASSSSVTYTLYTAVSNASGYLRILAGSDFDSANIILQEVIGS